MDSPSIQPGDHSGAQPSSRRGGRRGHGGFRPRGARQRLSLALLDTLTRDEVDVSLFLGQAESRAIRNSAPFALYRIIHGLDELEHLDPFQIACRRLLLVEFYYLSDVLTELEEGSGHMRLCHYIRQQTDSPDVRISVRQYVWVGKRYQGFMDDLGGIGALFCLHQDTQRGLEQRIPKAGPLREEFLAQASADGVLHYAEQIRDGATAVQAHLRSLLSAWVANIPGQQQQQQQGQGAVLGIDISSSQTRGSSAGEGVNKAGTDTHIKAREGGHGLEAGRCSFFDVVLLPDRDTETEF